MRIREKMGQFKFVCVLVSVSILASSAVPASEFDLREDRSTTVALSFPLGGTEKRIARLQLQMNGPSQDRGFVTSEPTGPTLPLVTLDFDPYGASNLALGGLTLWQPERLYAAKGDDGGTDWGTAAWIALGVAVVGGLAFAISEADDELFDAEKLCREQGGHLVNGQCVPN